MSEWVGEQKYGKEC